MKLLYFILFFSLAAACSDPDDQSEKLWELPPVEDAGADAADAGQDEGEPCDAESDAEMCERFGYICGALTETDNCGATRVIESCGDVATVCNSFQTCVAGACSCTPESDAGMCQRLSVECGPLNDFDNCGEAREIESCGDEMDVCSEYETCGAVEVGQCGCVIETDAEFCLRLGVECGEWEGTDNCGVERLVESCGDELVVCGPLDTCGGGGTPGLCSCTPETDEQMCTRLGYECGELDALDNCGAPRVIPSCGIEADVCDTLQTCGGGGTPGQCGCTARTDAQLCSLAGYTCGELVITDECGVERTIASCGPACLAPLTCGGGVAVGQCGCTPDSDENICDAADAECGNLQLVDNCNANRTVQCALEEDVCTFFDTCGGGGEANQCGCTPTTCEAQGLLCGTHPNGCGGTMECTSFCVEKLAAGATHVCAIGSGRLKCWGRNHQGQIGDGTTTQRNNPVNVANTTLPTLADVAPGNGNTCVLTSQGAVHCWGSNAESQLGVGTTVDNRSPGAPAISTGASQVVVGETHVCALVGGAVKCWGSNSYGKIGTSGLLLDVKVGVPNDVDLLDADVTQLAAGQHHTCALKSDGSVWCWGRNRMGQLGNLKHGAPHNPLSIDAYGFDGSLISSLDLATYAQVPVEVAGLPEAVFITAGEDYTCAIDVDDKVWCWGAMVRTPTTSTQCPVVTGTDNNSNPIMTNATSCAIFPPAPPTGQPEVGHPITRYTKTLVADSTSSCADVGECPANAEDCTNGRCRYPQYPISNVYVDRAALSPVQAGYTTAALYVGAGANHLCAVVEDPILSRSNVQCFGLNTRGQLGDGTNNGWTSPVRLYLDTNDEVVRASLVAAGDNFSCALVEDANVKCWGSNQYGQIGNSALVTSESFRPFDVKLDFQP